MKPHHGKSTKTDSGNGRHNGEVPNQETFQNIPIFDGKDPAMFDDWVERIELACSLSGRNIKEEVISYSAGPVQQMLLTLPDDPQYTWPMMKVEM